MTFSRRYRMFLNLVSYDLGTFFCFFYYKIQQPSRIPHNQFSQNCCKSAILLQQHHNQKMRYPMGGPNGHPEILSVLYQYSIRQSFCVKCQGIFVSRINLVRIGHKGLKLVFWTENSCFFGLRGKFWENFGLFFPLNFDSLIPKTHSISL